ncbi:MAG TPA: hypothetical protein VF753_04245 [Terriglobales bacterium]
MELHNHENLCSELIQLTDEQIRTIEKRTSRGITEAEQTEYEERQKRIRGLFMELYHLDRAA